METQTSIGGLISGDVALIAENIGVSKVYVSELVAGRKGKHQTLQQVRVMMAAEFGRQMNAQKIAYYRQLALSDNIIIAQ